MLNQIEIDTLIMYLRRELDQIEQAILVLERMALAQPAQARFDGRRTTGQPAARAGVYKRWANHRLRTE